MVFSPNKADREKEIEGRETEKERQRETRERRREMGERESTAHKREISWCPLLSIECIPSK